MGRYDILLQQEEVKIEQTPPEPRKLSQETPKVQSDRDLPVRPNARTIERPNGKRIITRNSFEIYEDQMDDLRESAFQDKRQGKIGSMSAMVRDAIDQYLRRSHK